MPADLSDTISLIHSFPSSGLSDADRSLVTQITTAVEMLQASLSTYGTVRYQIEQFEKLLCDPWMEDQKLFTSLYSSWSQFLSQYQSEIGAMTVNERLCVMGLMDDFEGATGHPDRLRAILRAAFLSPPDVEAIIHRHMA